MSLFVCTIYVQLINCTSGVTEQYEHIWKIRARISYITRHQLITQ